MVFSVRSFNFGAVMRTVVFPVTFAVLFLVTVLYIYTTVRLDSDKLYPVVRYEDDLTESAHNNPSAVSFVRQFVKTHTMVTEREVVNVMLMADRISKEHASR